MDEQLRLDIEEKIKHILVSELEVNLEILAMSNASTPLLGRGIGLDSMETLTLVAGIEKEFDIQIADEDLTANLFKNIATLAEYVLQQLSGQRHHPRGGTPT
jgi:acyl carrier protein